MTALALMAKASGRGVLKLGLIIAAVTLVLDQITKWLARDALWEPERQVEVTGFFNLVPVENRGISFGLLESESGFGPWLIAGLAVVISGALLFWMARAKRWLLGLALGLIVGGAIGNVVDRARLGWVIDFIDLHAGGYHWPAFNLADSGITIGVGLLLIDSLFRPSRPTT